MTSLPIPASAEFQERYALAVERSGTPMADAVVRRMMSSSVAYTAAELLGGPPEPPYNGRFIIGRHHLAWDNIVTTQKRFCVLAPRDHSKCSVTGTVLQTPSGLVPVESWTGGEVWAYDQEQNAVVASYSPAVLDNGIKRSVEIHTDTGRLTRCTINHPLKVVDGWCRADELEPGRAIRGVTRPADPREHPALTWERVTRMRDLGDVQTWAMQVPAHRTYLADGLVQHNTFFFDFAFPIWQMICNPRGIGLIFSGTSAQAIRILDDIKTEIETNPRLQFLYPGTNAGKWSATQLQMANGHRLYCKGYMSRTRGIHPSYIICDDILDDSAMYSEMTRTKTTEFFFSSVSNMVIPSGVIAVVSTPFHSRDLYCGELANNPKYFFATYPAISAKGKPLWPARYNLAALDEKKREIGNVRFTREFLCEPITDEMSLFPKSLFMTEKQIMPGARLGMDLQEWRALGIRNVVIGVDIAFSGDVGSDYFVIWVQGTCGKGNRWIMDMFRDKGLGFQRQKQLILDMGTRYQPELVFIESNQAQRILADELIQYTSLPVRKYVTGTEKNTLTEGVPSLRILLENEKYRIPRGDARSITMTDIWIEECNAFTFYQGKAQSVGGHDDTVMAAFIAEQASRAGGFSFSFGDGSGAGDNPRMPTPQTPVAPPPTSSFDATAPNAMDLISGGGF